MNALQQLASHIRGPTTSLQPSPNESPARATLIRRNTHLTNCCSMAEPLLAGPEDGVMRAKY
jgi:hypothetical protein